MVDVVRHEIDLELTLKPPSLTGAGDVRVKATRATDLVVLDAQGIAISEASINHARAPFGQQAGRLWVKLSKPLSVGEELTIHFAWSVPPNREIPHFTEQDVWAGYSTAAWMPTRFGSSQRATLVLRIHAPKDLVVTASGARGAESSEQTSAIHTFTVDRPSPPFLYAFAAGYFEEARLDVDNVSLRALGPHGADLRGALAITEVSMRYLRERAGTPYPFSEYTQVFVQGDAAQEAAGLAIISRDDLDAVKKDPNEDWVFTHELAHQWFGIDIQCANFTDFWLNEGFATFFTAAAKESRWGRGAYDRELGLWSERSTKVHAAGKDAPVSLANALRDPSAVTDADLQPRGVTYSRGALILAKLRATLGDETFWNGMKRYAAARAGHDATTEDLRSAFEAASRRDLRPFFAKWVYAPAPELTAAAVR